MLNRYGKLCSCHEPNISIHRKPSRRTSPPLACLDPRPKTGEEYFTGFKRGKLYLLASKGLIRSFTLRDPGNVQGCRFFHLQSILDYLERCEKRERGESVGTDAEKISTAPTLKGQTVYAANALTGGGNEYLIGIFAGESDAWLAAQRELDQGRKVWIVSRRLSGEHIDQSGWGFRGRFSPQVSEKLKAGILTFILILPQVSFKSADFLGI